MDTDTLRAPAALHPAAPSSLPQFVLHGNESAVTEFAFAELRRFLTAMPSLDGLEEIQVHFIAASHDAFEFEIPDAERLCIRAANDRSVLFAVYALLESLGWCFAVPGEDHLDQRACSPAGWRTLTGRSEATQAWRGLTIGCPSLDEIARVIDWMPKVRLNSLFLCHGVNDQTVPLLPEFHRRGIRVEAGGHILKSFLPETLFAAHPDYFRMKDGQRRADGNFCSSHPGAVQVIVENAIAYARQLPVDSIFHFWGDDVEAGSWCECPRCSTKSPTHQMMAAVNAITDALHRELPAATADFLLYHDTIDIPARLNPQAHTFGLYAPRERCYAHSLGDPACAHNRWYVDCFNRAQQAFGSRIRVFEYYTSFMLWRCMGIAAVETLLADLKWYRSQGVSDIQTMQFGQITNWSYPVNIYAFARAAWDDSLSRDTIVADFCRARYGSHADAMMKVIDAMEAATMNMATYCGYDHTAYDLRDVPLAPADFAGRHKHNVERAIGLTIAAMESLPRDETHPTLAADRVMLELNRDNLQALLHQMSDEHDAAIALLHKLRQRMASYPELLGAWGEAPDQFNLIANMLETAKTTGRRIRDW